MILTGSLCLAALPFKPRLALMPDRHKGDGIRRRINPIQSNIAIIAKADEQFPEISGQVFLARATQQRECRELVNGGGDTFRRPLCSPWVLFFDECPQPDKVVPSAAGDVYLWHWGASFSAVVPQVLIQLLASFQVTCKPSCWYAFQEVRASA